MEKKYFIHWQSKEFKNNVLNLKAEGNLIIDWDFSHGDLNAFISHTIKFINKYSNAKIKNLVINFIKEL